MVSNVDPVVLLAAVALIGVAALAVILLLKGQGRQAETDARLLDLREQTLRLLEAQAQLGGRLQQLAETQSVSTNTLAERFQAQERAVGKVLEERLSDVRKHVGDNMQDLRERLTVIDAAQKNITELSGQVVELQDILSNKQSRGAFGEVRLFDLIKDALPPSAYAEQATLSNGRRADCLLKLPNPPGSIVIDAKFPREAYLALIQAGDEAARVQAGRQFAADVLKHVKDVQEKYIIPNETAESALMFLPSEAIYAELHANFPNVVEESYRRRVWIVSPTTLMATLNTVRAVLKDARMREQADIIQKYVGLMLEDVKRLDERVGKLETHFRQANTDIEDIRKSSNSIAKRGEKIVELEVGGDGIAAVLPSASPRIELGN